MNEGQNDYSGQKTSWPEWLKAIGAVLTPILVAVFGLLINRSIEERRIEETRTQVYSQIMNSREQSECNLRKDMFGQIINSLFGSDIPADLGTRVLNLEILGYNFRESLNLKPLFLHIDRAIKLDLQLDSAEWEDYARRIDHIIQAVKQQQLFALGMYGVAADLQFTRPDSTSRFQFMDRDSANVNQFFRDGPIKAKAVLTLDSVRFRDFVLEIGFAEGGDVDVIVNTRDPHPDSSKTYSTINLALNKYDLPMINNTRLSQNERFTVVLKRVEATSINLSFVYFPGDHGSIKDRPFYDDILRNLRSVKVGKVEGECKGG